MDQQSEVSYAHADQPAFEHMQIDHSISRAAIFFICFLTIGVFYFTLVACPVARLLPIQQLQQIGSALNPTSSARPNSTTGSAGPSGALGGSQIGTAPAASASGPAAAASSPAAAPAEAPATSAQPSEAAKPAVAAASAAPAASAATGGTYQVQSGDTLSSIARKYNTTVQALASANKIADSGTLRVGQRLIIPR